MHKSGGFVVNLYEGEDLFAIAGIAAKSFPIFSTITRSLGNRNHKWSTGHPPSHLHFLKSSIMVTMMMIMVTMLNILTTIIRAASHLGFQEKL